MAAVAATVLVVAALVPAPVEPRAAVRIAALLVRGAALGGVEEPVLAGVPFGFLHVAASHCKDRILCYLSYPSRDTLMPRRSTQACSSLLSHCDHSQVFRWLERCT